MQNPTKSFKIAQYTFISICTYIHVFIYLGFKVNYWESIKLFKSILCKNLWPLGFYILAKFCVKFVVLELSFLEQEPQRNRVITVHAMKHLIFIHLEFYFVSYLCLQLTFFFPIYYPILHLKPTFWHKQKTNEILDFFCLRVLELHWLNQREGFSSV